jgi:GNAT superfamily N-acetyltransferase
MSAVSPSRPDRGPASYLPQGFAVALVAAVIGYALHHIPPLSGHPDAGVTVALVAAAIAATGVRVLSRRPDTQAFPAVVVAPPGEVQVDALGADDVDFCAALHTESLGHGFFVQLGPRFLRAYYSAFRTSPHAVAFVAKIADQPVGMLAGVLQPRSHAAWVLRHCGPALALRAAAAMLLRPTVALRFLRTRLARYATAWRRHRQSETRAGSDLALPAVLSHVAVVPGARGSGAGTALVRAFEEQARRAGVHSVTLTTLEGVAGAGRFYARLGWELSEAHATPDGRRVERWSRRLDGGQTQ